MKGSKTGGREQGTPNKMTSDLRERISNFLNANWDQIEKDFSALQPEKRIVIFEKLLQYSLPRLQTTELITPPPEPIKKQMTHEEREAEIDRLRKKLWPEAWEVMNRNKNELLIQKV
jgi:hypothetical protein